jgi:hypothetical protein
MVATIPEPINRARTAADSTGTRENPPVSGSSLEGEAVGLLVALEVGLAEALLDALGEAEALETGLVVALSSIPRSSALPIALAEAEALAAGLAVASSIPRSSEPFRCIPRSCMPRSSIPRSSIPRAPIPLSSAPMSSDWAAATGAKTNTANATDKTNNTELRTVSPRFRLRIHGEDAPREAA